MCLVKNVEMVPMVKYHNRQQAGQQLAEALKAYAGQDDVLVLALPRGGVPVAFEVAKALHAPLDVLIVRKLGVPGHAELAMGAIASGGEPVFNQSIIRHEQITPEEIAAVIAKERQELHRRESAYRGNKPFPAINGKTIILIDDGIATGATMRAAIQSLRAAHPKRLIVAVPVVGRDTFEEMSQLADEFLSPLKPIDLSAVGEWYDDFSQTEDDEVLRLLQKKSA